MKNINTKIPLIPNAHIEIRGIICILLGDACNCQTVVNKSFTI